MKPKRDQSIETILKSFVTQKRIAKGYNEVDLKKFWSDEMGETINKYTKSIRLRNEIVTAEISSIPLRTELQYSKAQVLKLLQDQFGYEKIRDIRIL